MNEDVTFCHKEGVVFLHLQFTHGLIALVGKDLDDHCFLHMLLPACHHRHTHTVTIHGKQRVTLRDKDSLTAIVGLERVLAIGLTDERTLLYLCLQVQTVGIVRRLRQEVVPCHFVHYIDSQHLCRMRRKL